MVEKKIIGILILSLVFIIIFLGIASACHHCPYCGDGDINQHWEECDDGDSNGVLCWAGYGSSCTYCTSNCKLKTITNYCGDGILNSACEECDDGNNVNNDGCSSNCEIEEPCNYCGDGICNNNETCLSCPEDCGDCPPTIYCGDGECNGDETCSTCEEDCGICPPSSYCGDGVLDSGEECDFGENNGVICDNSDVSCMYCSLNCEKIILSYEDEEDEDDDDDENSKKGIEFEEVCEPNWKCTGWSECSDGFTTRTCKDTNYCEYSYGKPIEVNYCEEAEVLTPEKENSLFKGIRILSVPVLLFIFILLLIILILLIAISKK